MNQSDNNNQVARLLALCLAQNQNSISKVNLEMSASIMNEDVFASHNKLILNQANELYHKATEIINNHFTKELESSAESRTQPRADVTYEIQIKIPSSEKNVIGKLLNISWGGMHVTSKEFLGVDNVNVNFVIPYPHSDDIQIEGKIIRSWSHEGLFHSAIRFTKLGYKDDLKLNKLLHLFFNSYDQKKENTFFSHHINISYWDIEEFKTNLTDILHGKMNVLMPDPIAVGKSICIHIEGPNDYVEINLRAHVVHQEMAFVSEFPMYRMQLEFEYPSKEIQVIIKNMYQEAINIEHTNHLEHKQTRINTAPSAIKLFSLLEIHHPNILKKIQLFWGNKEFNDYCDSLITVDDGKSDFDFNTIQELEFLREVHRISYPEFEKNKDTWSYEVLRMD
ncbi:MAG: PilZ domain-containing protein [Gammaproteobacteria bacterium]|nr:PilZ domain-containing protein [Gammaproteobacteria bacterium]